MVAFLSILVVGFVIVFGTVGVVTAIHSRSKYGASHKDVKGLSWASMEILKEYNNLPSDNKPYGDIVSMLRALDIQKDVASVNRHFRHSGWDSSYYSWSCGCRKNDSCLASGHKDLRKSIKAIASARAKQDHALAVSAVQHDIDEVKHLTQRLREEASLINQVTKELT